MRKAMGALTALLVLGSWRLMAQEDANAVVDGALKAMGADVTSIQYAGAGSSYTLGQSPRPGGPWPGATVKNYLALVDYDTPSMRVEIVRTQMTSPPAGVFAQTIAGEQRQIQVVSGSHAWNVAGENVMPAPAAVGDRLTQLWITPYGFLKAAKASAATASRESVGGRTLTRLSFSAHGRNKVTGLVNEQHLVEKVETWVDNPVLGDMLIETSYADYKDFGGVTFPSRIVQKQGGFPTLELTVSAVTTNVPVNIEVPPNVPQASIPAIKVDAQKIADGVWYLTGGSHHSVAVEFADHLVVIEGPQSEARSSAVIAEVKKTIPAKPIKYLVNTHHHFDHSGGIRTYAAEGVTIVTLQANKSFYEKAFAAPRTLNPDRLAQSKKAAAFDTFTGKKVLADGTRTLELHHVEGNVHDEAFLMAYLPKEKILIEVDAYTPAAPNATPPPAPSPSAVNLYENIQRLKLDVVTVAALHGRAVTLAELQAAVGKSPSQP
jgi:glyoxylase-like metal-dependent hydrolase (beta-lactamase superfamily II)